MLTKLQTQSGQKKSREKEKITFETDSRGIPQNLRQAIEMPVSIKALQLPQTL